MNGAASLLLAPATWLYLAGLRVHQAMYRSGMKQSSRAAIPVVCIGNLSMGGTGKTPVVEYTARALREMGHWPAIVSRGYKRRTAPDEVVLVSDGEHVLVKAEQSGDEPLLLANRLPGVAVAVCANRAKACEMIVQRGLASCIVLDDGFQHLALEREMNVVLIDARHNLAKMRLIPAGTLREPISALQRAHVVVHTVSEDIEHLDANRELAAKWIAPDQQFEFRLKPVRLRRLADGHIEPLSFISAKRALAFAGIAHPEKFFASLRAAGANVRGLPLTDHTDYSTDMICRLQQAARDANADTLITTEKDAVKLANVPEEFAQAVFALETQGEMSRADEFLQMVQAPMFAKQAEAAQRV